MVNRVEYLGILSLPNAFKLFIYTSTSLPRCGNAAFWLVANLERSDRNLHPPLWGGTPLYRLYRYMRPQKVKFSTVLIIRRVSILAILVIKRVWLEAL